MSSTGKNTSGEADSYNMLRDSPLRFMGYINEVGESFRYQFPKFVFPSYVLAFGYCIADAAQAGSDTYCKAVAMSSQTAALDSTVSIIDCLIWQSLASVMIPGATINAFVRASRFALARSPAVVPPTILAWAPTVVGLGSIPMIVHPIDHGVDVFMDATYRKINFHKGTPKVQSPKE